MLAAVTTQPETTSIGRASALMASGSIVSRVLGIVRNALMVACVGAEASASVAFNTANTLPNQIFALLQGGLLTTLLLPQLTKALGREDGGEQTADALVTWAIAAIVGVTAVSLALAQPIAMALQLAGPTLQLGVTFAFWCLPQILFYGLYTVWSQVLYARGRFAATMWTPVLANVVQIVGMSVFLVRFAKSPDAELWTPQMVALLGGTFTLGIAVQALALVPSLRASGYRWRPRFELRGHGFRATARLASWTIAAVTIAQLGGFVTTAAINAVAGVAGHVLVPNITVYQQAFQMFFVPHGIITITILTAAFPRMARAAQTADVDALRAQVVTALRLPLTAMVPITLAAIALSLPGMAVTNPSMTPVEVRHTAIAFSLMALGLIPYAVAGLQQRYSMAREDGRTNLMFTAIVTGIQVAAALAIPLLPSGVGVYVVASGMTLGNTVAAIVFLHRTQTQLGGLPFRELLSLVGRLALAAVPAAILAALAVAGLGGWFRPGWGVSLLQLAVGGAVFAIAFGLVAKRLHIGEIEALIGRLAGRFARCFRR